VKRVGSIETYEAMRRAFRDLTDVDSDGAPTRARVLARASRDLERRNHMRRLAVPVAATLIASGAASGALAVFHHWRAPAPTMVESAGGAGSSGVTAAPRIDGRAVRVIPFEKTAPLDGPTGIGRRLRPSSPISEAETRAYARAHQAHFADGAPARALEAWDAYLAAFPHGTFGPEATYNRAICLVRLDRRAEAARVLRPLAAAPAGSYRREEALRLLDWLSVPGAD
jgi:hypothetical protein